MALSRRKTLDPASSSGAGVSSAPEQQSTGGIMTAPAERDTSPPVIEAGGPVDVATPVRAGTKRGSRTIAYNDQTSQPPKRRYRESRKYRADAQDMLGIGQVEIDRVASLPDMDLFKRPVGRPSRYHPSMCEQVIRLGENGNSETQIAVKLGVDRVTMLGWAETHPEFSTSLNIARDSAKAWWEDMGMIGLVSERFNTGVWSKSMSARFRDEYVDRKQTEIAGEIVEKRELTINARSLDADAREALKQALLSVKRAVDGDED
jgi:hypothetical protein